MVIATNASLTDHNDMPRSGPAVSHADRSAVTGNISWPESNHDVSHDSFSALRVACQSSAEHSINGSKRAVPMLDAPANPKPSRIAIKTNKTILLVESMEISAVEAEGNYVILRTAAGSHILRRQISELVDKLAAYDFIQIHRSVLVNMAHVESIEPLPSGDCNLHMRGGKLYNVTRTYKKNLRRLAGLWIGANGFDNKGNR